MELALQSKESRIKELEGEMELLEIDNSSLKKQLQQQVGLRARPGACLPTSYAFLCALAANDAEAGARGPDGAAGAGEEEVQGGAREVRKPQEYGACSFCGWRAISFVFCCPLRLLL